ncbi:uncharacterized protein [Haliotis cracherodii]|uniref:uncharacterized protein n=1 Tax=Haliotis cracherodii TaxID=6455 RepID=UPI0039ED50F6
MSSEFRSTSHHELGHHEITRTPDGQDILDENSPAEHVSVDETKSTTDSNPGSVEYHYIDDVNPASAFEERQSEVDDDYECIADTNPAYDYLEAINEPRTPASRNSAVDKCKKTMLFLGPIFASVTVNIIAGFFYSFPFLVPVISRRAFSEGTDPDVKIPNIYWACSGLAAASCAPLMIKCGFRKVALGGSVLLNFYSILSPLSTTGDILTIILNVMGGFAVGLLRTTGVVASLDHLYTRPVLALITSYASFLIGAVSSSIVLITCNYLDSRLDWSDAMSVFAITAVIGLLAGSFLKKNLQTQQNVPKLFTYPPFYFLMLIRLVASLGMFSQIYNEFLNFNQGAG